jgi:hypothetical protein
MSSRGLQLFQLFQREVNSSPFTCPTTDQGLTLAHFRAQVVDLRDISPSLAVTLSTFGTNPRINLGNVGDQLSFI